MTRARWLLAIDTSTAQAGIGLHDGAQMTELSWHAGRTQTISILPAIHHLLESLDLTVTDVGAIGVARGPGTFTGLRVGLGIAKGMVIQGDRRLIAVDTLAVTAEPFVQAGVPVLVVLPAGRERLVWAVYDQRSEASAPRNTTLIELQDFLTASPDLLVTGELLPDQRSLIERGHGRVLTAACSARRPGVLAEMAWTRWEAGRIDDPGNVEPLYLHGTAGSQ